MKWHEFLSLTQKLPLIERAHLLAGQGGRNPKLAVQLARWVKSGKLVQLRRGVYLLEEAYRKVQPFEAYLAARLKHPSYISLEKALEYHQIIPEGVSWCTCITTARSAEFKTSCGDFRYRHIQTSLFWGYATTTQAGQSGYLAHPEKALLDLFYFYSGEPSLDYIRELRLQNLDALNLGRLLEYAARFESPKLGRAASRLAKFIAS